MYNYKLKLIIFGTEVCNNKLIMEALFCNMCTRQFQRKHAYDSHVLTCPKLYDGECIPTQTQLYSMVLELHKKCEKMQNEIRCLKNMELQEKKKINLNTWLIENYSCTLTWESIRENMSKYMNNITDLLRTNTLQHVMLNIIENTEGNLPCVMFSHKKQHIYVYHDSGRWCEYNFSTIRDLYNSIHKELINQLNNWATSKGNALYSDEHNSCMYHEMIEKVLCGSADDGLEKVFKKLDTLMRKKISVYV